MAKKKVEFAKQTRPTDSAGLVFTIFVELRKLSTDDQTVSPNVSIDPVDLMHGRFRPFPSHRLLIYSFGFSILQSHRMHQFADGIDMRLILGQYLSELVS